MDEKNKILGKYSQEPMSPLVSMVFAKIFENKESAGIALQHLINAVRDDARLTPISELEYVKSEDVQLAEIGSRGCRIDVLAKDINGSFTSVEIQVNPDRTMNDRALFNYAQIAQNYIPKGSTHADLPYISMVNILDYNLRESREDYHQQAEIRYTNEPFEQAATKFRIHNLELPRFREIFNRLGEPMLKESKLALWLYTFDKGYINPDFLKGVSKVDVGFEQFVERYNLVGADHELRYSYGNYITGQRDQQRLLKQARQDGRLDIFRNMYREKLPQHVIDMAAKAAKVSKEELEQIRKSVQIQKPPSNIPR